MRRGNIKPETPCEATEKRFYHMSMPLAVARSVYDCSQRDGVPALTRAVEVRRAGESTVLAATDTKILVEATSPTVYEIPDGSYFHEFAPFRFKTAGAILLSKLDHTFPDWRTRILPEAGLVAKQIGTFFNEKDGVFSSGFGRLEIIGSFCANYRLLSNLAPAVYSVHRVIEHPAQKNSQLYIFDGCCHGWKMRYVLSGMTASDFGEMQGATL